MGDKARFSSKTQIAAGIYKDNSIVQEIDDMLFPHRGDITDEMTQASHQCRGTRMKKETSQHEKELQLIRNGEMRDGEGPGPPIAESGLASRGSAMHHVLAHQPIELCI